MQEQFLQEQKDRYRPQLLRYRALIDRLFADNPKPVRIALYFTGLGELHELLSQFSNLRFALVKLFFNYSALVSCRMRYTNHLIFGPSAQVFVLAPLFLGRATDFLLATS